MTSRGQASAVCRVSWPQILSRTSLAPAKGFHLLCMVDLAGCGGMRDPVSFHKAETRMLTYGSIEIMTLAAGAQRPSKGSSNILQRRYSRILAPSRFTPLNPLMIVSHSETPTSPHAPKLLTIISFQGRQYLRTFSTGKPR